VPTGNPESLLRPPSNQWSMSDMGCYQESTDMLRLRSC
jgi:hypothetical protein